MVIIENRTMKQLHLLLIMGLILMAGCQKDNITTTNDADSGSSDDGSYSDTEFDRTITIVYSSDGVSVSGEGDSQELNISSAGATITNTGSEKVQYNVSGSTSNGFLKIYSDTKQAIVLSSASITNTSGAALNIQSNEPSYIALNGSSTLSDGSKYSSTPSDEDEKGTLFAEGSLLFSGSGSLTVLAKGKSGIVTDDNLTISSGTITINCTASTFVSNGDTTKVAGMKGKDAFRIIDGTLTVTSSGTGAKGICGDGSATFAGGTVDITVTGSNFGSSSGGFGGGPGGGGQSSNDNSVAAKGIKFDGNINITGGTLNVSASSHEAIETKSELTISGGYVFATSSDDAINSSSDLTISGGHVMAYSTGNDGIDANGNLYIKGGNLLAISTSGAEVALDANTEDNKQLYITGGNIVAIGGLEQGASVSGGTAKQASSYSKGTWYALYNGTTVAFAFKVPSNSNMGAPMVVYTTDSPSLKSGVTGSGTSFWNGYGYTSCSGGSEVTLSTYSGGNSGGGPGRH